MNDRAVPQAGVATWPDTPPGRVTKVGLVQINNSFSGQNYLPYSVACLESYFVANGKEPWRFEFLPAIYRRLPVRQAVEELADADVVGFSTYVWNVRISLEIARRLKAIRPAAWVVFGGPQVPDLPEEFLRAHPFVDVAVHNEGEQTFRDLLELPDRRELQGVLGISYIDAQGRWVKTPPRPRLRELLELPSPFLEGRFERLMEQNPSEAWIGLWETNRGCPFSCTFCDWGSATASKVNQFEMERIRREAEWFAKKRIEYVFCCDANFGILKRDVEIAECVADIKRRTGYPKSLSVQNTKNATERAYLTQKILSDAGLNKGVALSMQSLDDHTLESIKRDNISLDTYMELQRRFTKDRVETYSDLILGLPGETFDSYLEGIAVLMENGQHNRIQFNDLSILPNAEMASPAQRAEFGIETIASEIINIHGSREAGEDDVPEIQELVVATASMPREDWQRARAISWMTALLYYDKLFQIPMILARHFAGIPYRRLLESFWEFDAADYPLLAEIRRFFLDEARAIQEGGPEYVYSAEWLGIFWPADEFVFIKLTAEESLARFYEEAGRLLLTLVEGRDEVPKGALVDAIALNRALVKQPFLTGDTFVDTDYDVLSYYDAVRTGEPPELRETPTRTLVTRSRAEYAEFADWCREVVWWGNKKGAYLYGSEAVEKQLAGHF